MANVNTISKGRVPRPIRQTKLQETCGQIEELAETLGPDAKLPTVIQLRDRFGVSVATLNSALSELEAQRIIRRKHGVGIYVSPRIRHRRVCLICDPSFFRVSGGSPFWNILVDQVRRRAEAEREAFSFHFTADDPTAASQEEMNFPLESGLANDLTNRRVDGILCVGVRTPTMDWLEKQQIPIVAFAGPGPYIIGIESNEIIRQGVTGLASRGCKRIAYWSPVAPYRTGAPGVPLDRRPVARFAESLAAVNLPFREALVERNENLAAQQPYHTVSHQEQGYLMASRIFGPESDPHQRPDGIVSSDDMLTQGALAALQRLGIKIGEVVQIATHANVGSPALIGWENDLIMVEVEPAEIVRQMFDTMENLMDGKAPAKRVYEVMPRL
ncbi:MAG: GntR family transcriptional regulator, partial [Armatimonadota bacterium]